METVHTTESESVWVHEFVEKNQTFYNVMSCPSGSFKAYFCGEYTDFVEAKAIADKLAAKALKRLAASLN